MSSTAPPLTNRATIGCPHCGQPVALGAKVGKMPAAKAAPAPVRRMPPSPVDPNAIKRGPGRPPKVKPPTMPPTPLPPVAKRGPGRPPKVAAAPKANGNGEAAQAPTTARVAMTYSLTKGVDPDAIKAPQRKAVAYAIQGAGTATTGQLASRLQGSPLFPRQDKLKADISAIVSGLKREGLVTGSRVA